MAGALAAPIAGMAAAGPFRVIHLGIHQIEDGPAIGDRVSFVPGETIYLRFDVENYTRTAEQKTAIAWVIEATDPKGIPIVPPIQGKKEATLQEEDKDWLPRVRVPIEVPSPAPGGSYSLHIKVTDTISNNTATADTKFSVSGAQFPPAQELAIRNFGFFHSEEDPHPLESPAYRAGESMYARFQIAGYKYGPANAIEVTYGISILGPAGNVMYTQDPAVEEKSASFYPKPWVDANMSLSLNAGTKAGEYTLVIKVNDKVGNQTAEIRKPFHVE
jgi:hypothetical protein